MAATPEGARLTEAHRLAQLRIGAETVRQLVAIWPLLDIADLDGTTATWLATAVPVIEHQGRRSATLAGEYIRAFRTIELGNTTGLRPVFATVDVPALTTSLRVTGPVSIKNATAAGIRPAAAAETALTQSSGAGMRHAVGAGRGTIDGTVRADPAAHGWARITGAKACSFCAMLASRGGVYGADTVGVQAHDACGCSAEPDYSADHPMPAQSQRWADLWREAKTADGDTETNFRRLVTSTS